MAATRSFVVRSVTKGDSLFNAPLTSCNAPDPESALVEHIVRRHELANGVHVVEVRSGGVLQLQGTLETRNGEVVSLEGTVRMGAP